MGVPTPAGRLLYNTDAAILEINRLLESGQALLKAPFACSGRGHLRVNTDSQPERTRGWIENTLAAHGAVVVERWLERVMDFSALYEMRADGSVEWIGMTRMENDAAGRFSAIRVSSKWGSLLDSEMAAFLFRDARAMEIYQDDVPHALADTLPGYVGPLCVDALVFRRRDGTLALKPVVELNVRMTMGRLAWEWMKRSPHKHGGKLRILRKAAMDEDAMRALRREGEFLNDVEAAEVFLGHWSSSTKGL